MELVQEHTTAVLHTLNGEISESYLKKGLSGQAGGHLPLFLSSDTMTVKLSYTYPMYLMSSSARGEMIRLENWEDFAPCAQIIIDKYKLMLED